MKLNLLLNPIINKLFKSSRINVVSDSIKTFSSVKAFSIKAYMHTQKKRNNSLNYSLIEKQKFNFSQSKREPLKTEEVPQQNLQVVVTEQTVSNQQVQVFHTKGTLSILDKVPGAKHTKTGDLYVLMFTCGQCQCKQIKSFTKTAYHKGVVLVRCEKCQSVHLVADNLGWFEDQPVNIQTLHKQKVQKVHDPAAIQMFLQRAFSSQEELLHHKHDENCQHNHQHTDQHSHQNQHFK